MVQVRRATLWIEPDECTAPHKQLPLAEPCHDQLADCAAQSLPQALGNPIYILAQNVTEWLAQNQICHQNLCIFIQNLLVISKQFLVCNEVSRQIVQNVTIKNILMPVFQYLFLTTEQ